MDQTTAGQHSGCTLVHICTPLCTHTTHSEDGVQLCTKGLHTLFIQHHLKTYQITIIIHQLQDLLTPPGGEEVSPEDAVIILQQQQGEGWAEVQCKTLMIAVKKEEQVTKLCYDPRWAPWSRGGTVRRAPPGRPA